MLARLVAATFPRLFHTKSSPYRSMSTAVHPVYSWCCTAGFDDSKEQGTVVLSKISGYPNNNQAFANVEGHTLDLTESPGWMEYIERTEDRMSDVGGAGAYDTVRCDLLVDSESDRWRVWGQDFHLQRLQSSFQAVVEDSEIAGVQEGHFEQALQQSSSIMKELLAEAERAEMMRKRQAHESFKFDDVEIRLVRLTLLWSPNKAKEPQTIIVRGHACSTAQPIYLRSSVKPIVASLAAHRTLDGSVAMNDNLPSRHDNSQCKIASWTRLRKQMEQPNAYKPAGVAEVFMMRQAHGDLELLEGLSSNMFVVYNDGTLRTAPKDVLFGYVRHLVLENASNCNLELSQQPILLSQVDQWQEVFITSSSRLIHPVARILIQSKSGKDEFEEFWSNPSPNEKSKSMALLEEILRRNGYPRLC